jgi:hypothetical protein
VLYVADAGNGRIQEFTTDGNFIRMWGKDVVSAGTEDKGTGFEICQLSACKQAATSTGLIGEMSVPLGVATDTGHNVYVADNASQRIQKFDEEGIPIRAWGKDVVSTGPDSNSTNFEICKSGVDTCKAGVTGGAEGEMNTPFGVAVDGNGMVYVVDTNNSRIDKFASTGGFQFAWGKDVVSSGPDANGTNFEVCHAEIDFCKAGNGAGHLGGDLNNPDAVATDTEGKVYIGEEDNSRIDRFGSDGTFQRLWGRDVDSVAPSAGFEICTVAANCQGSLNITPAHGGEVVVPNALATDLAGNLYVADRFNNRVEKFADPPAAGAPPPAVTPSTPVKKKKCKKKKKRKAADAKTKKCKKKKH